MPYNVASDTFPSLSAAWTQITASAMTVVGGELQVAAGGNPCGVWRNDIGPNGPWQFSKFIVGTVIDNTVDAGIGPAVCIADAADTSYCVLLNSAASGRFQLVRRNAGTSTPLKTNTTSNPVTGEAIWLVKTPDYHLYVFRGFPSPATEWISFDDSASGSRLETGRVGAFGILFNNFATLDDFEGGDWPYNVRQPANVPALAQAVAGY